MNRQLLIDQVKDEYARLAEKESRMADPNQQMDAITPEAYYEILLGQVISGIEAGDFDSYVSGHDIVEAVANNTAG